MSNFYTLDTLRVFNQSTELIYGHGLQIWSGPLSSGRVALLLWNRSNQTATITSNSSDIGIADGTPVTIRDVWLVRPSYSLAFTTNAFSRILVFEMMRVLILNGVDVQHKTTKRVKKLYQIIQKVPSHAVKMFVITPIKKGCHSTEAET